MKGTDVLIGRLFFSKRDGIIKFQFESFVEVKLIYVRKWFTDDILFC